MHFCIYGIIREFSSLSTSTECRSVIRIRDLAYGSQSRSQHSSALFQVVRYESGRYSESAEYRLENRANSVN